MITDMNNVKTVSEFPPISTIPENKTKSSNIVQVYGFALQAFQSPPRRPVKLVFTDFTTYQDNVSSTRDAFLDTAVLQKLDENAIFSVSLNQAQAAKLLQQYKELYSMDLNLQEFSQLNTVGVLVKLEFYLKNFKNYLEGLCIDLEVIPNVTSSSPQELLALMDRIKANLETKHFHQNSPLTRYFATSITNAVAKRKRTDILFQPAAKKTTNYKDSRFDTQAILFNANFSSGEEDQSSGEDNESLDDEDEPFISVFTSLRHLKKLPLDQDNGKVFKLNGYLIEYQRGFDSVIFVEEAGLTGLNESNSIILRSGNADTFKRGKRLDLSVIKQVVSIGSIQENEFTLVT